MKVTLLDKAKHRRENFSCGVEELDTYIKKYAVQDVKRNITKVFVAQKEEGDILGYYTLSPFSFVKDEISPDLAKKLPHYPIPAVLIGRLAVDCENQNQGLGSFLLMDALQKINDTSETVFGIYAVVVDAKNDAAKEFYQAYGFKSFLKSEGRLFIPMKIVKQLVGRAAVVAA